MSILLIPALMLAGLAAYLAGCGLVARGLVIHGFALAPSLCRLGCASCRLAGACGPRPFCCRSVCLLG
jgi:hypothetical protein